MGPDTVSDNTVVLAFQAGDQNPIVGVAREFESDEGTPFCAFVVTTKDRDVPLVFMLRDGSVSFEPTHMTPEQFLAQGNRNRFAALYQLYCSQNGLRPEPYVMLNAVYLLERMGFSCVDSEISGLEDQLVMVFEATGETVDGYVDLLIAKQRENQGSLH